MIIVFFFFKASTHQVSGQDLQGNTCSAKAFTPTCGNGIVEPGEDCDPQIGSMTTCCDATDCSWKTSDACQLESTRIDAAYSSTDGKFFYFQVIKVFFSQ